MWMARCNFWSIQLVPLVLALILRAFTLGKVEHINHTGEKNIQHAHVALGVLIDI
jgi:hypothetical protein